VEIRAGAGIKLPNRKRWVLFSPAITRTQRRIPSHRTKENQWLLERVDHPQTDWLRDPVEPMLARPADKPPASERLSYEVKWDGIRALISLDEGENTNSRPQPDGSDEALSRIADSGTGLSRPSSGLV